LAAKRAGVKDIVLCFDNKQDVDEINKEYLEGLSFHYVHRMEEVLDIVLKTN
jgi:ATP-dependent Lon protease